MTLILINIIKVFRYYKKEKEIKELKKEDFIKAGFRFRSSSILVKGRYNKEIFLDFPDKIPL